MLKSLSFCLSVRLLISPSYVNEILAGYSNLSCRFFAFITLSISCHSLTAWRVSVERSAAILTGIPLCVICCFSLAAFNICSLCLIFVSLINMSLSMFPLGFHCFWALLLCVRVPQIFIQPYYWVISTIIFLLSWTSFLSLLFLKYHIFYFIVTVTYLRIWKIVNLDILAFSSPCITSASL